MKFIVIISISLSCSFGFVHSQYIYSDSNISWSSSRLLLSGDFIGKADVDSFGMALCATYILCKPYFINDSVMFKVEAIFSPTQSWKKKPALDSFDLNHEQVHFNITELFARKLRLAITEQTRYAKDGYISDLLARVDSTLQQISLECNKMQDLYDKETGHSVHRAKQIEWSRFIWGSLEELRDYDFTSIFVGKIDTYKN